MDRQTDKCRDKGQTDRHTQRQRKATDMEDIFVLHKILTAVLSVAFAFPSSFSVSYRTPKNDISKQPLYLPSRAVITGGLYS